MLRQRVAILFLLSGCESQQSFTLLTASAPDADLATSRVVIEGHTTMHYGYAKERWYQTVFPFLPILTIDDWWHDVDVAVDHVVKGSEPRTTLRIRKYRPLTEAEIASLPYPNDVMQIIGGELRVRIGYDRRSGDRLINLRIVAIENTPAMNYALEHATTRPASRRTSATR